MNAVGIGRGQVRVQRAYRITRGVLWVLAAVVIAGGLANEYFQGGQYGPPGLLVAVLAILTGLGFIGISVAAPLLERRWQRRYEATRDALRRVVDSGDSDTAPAAAVELGVLLSVTGDRTGARTAFRRAAGSGHPDHGPVGWLQLGLLLGQVGAPAAPGAPGASGPDGAAGSGGVRVAIGGEVRTVGATSVADLDAAQHALRTAMESGHEQAAPDAALALGVLLVGRGEHTAARSAFKVAWDSGHPDFGPRGAFNLAMSHHAEGQHRAAVAGYRPAIDSGHPEIAPLAALGLGQLRLAGGDLDKARSALQVAADSGHPEYAPAAAAQLAQLGQPD